MTIRYPNGERYAPNQTSGQSKQKQPVAFGKRGMTLEEQLNESNQYYLSHDMAVVHKKPTPLQIVKVDYPERSRAVVREAYFRQPSTTDYNGVYQGYYLDFDAKETKNKTSFPFHNFHEHQIMHLRQCLKQGGICFIIMKFVTLDRYFLFPAGDLMTVWDAQANGGRKSIPLAFIIEKSWEIQATLYPQLPYLAAVDQLIQRKKGGKNGK